MWTLKKKIFFGNLAHEIKVTNGTVIQNPYLKVQNESSSVKTKFDGNAAMFDVCGDDLKTKFQPTSPKQTSQNQLKLMFVDRS